jgi:hypothetical protein
MLRWLLLLGWRGRRSKTSLTALTRQDGAKDIVASANSRRRLLRWAGVLRRTAQRTRGGNASFLKGTAQVLYLFLVLLLDSQVSLFHSIDLFADELHLLYLCLNLMLKAFRGTHLAFELGSDLAEELIEPVTPVTRGNRPYPTMASVQRHNYLKW